MVPASMLEEACSKVGFLDETIQIPREQGRLIRSSLLAIPASLIAIEYV